MVPGQYIVVVTRNAHEALSGRYLSWELRDTLLVLLPGPSTLLCFLFRVPLAETTVAAQVLKTGTGGLNIDGCRVASASRPLVQRNLLNPNYSLSKNTYSGGQSIHFGSRAVGETLEGRWPSNLLLIHHAECVNHGVKRVKGSATSKSFHEAYAGKSTTRLLRGWSHPGNQHGDQDGLETVASWQCHSSCPVGLLDRQSGKFTSGIRSKPNIRRTSWKGYHGGDGVLGSAEVSYEDFGGASRFYPQFQNLAECLDWVTRLINT